MVRSSCGLNTRPRCKTHTGFMIIIKTSAAVCSSLLHSSGEWTTYSWQPPGSSNTPHFLYGQCADVYKSSLCPVYRQKEKKVSSAIHLFLTHTLVLLHLCEDTTNTSDFLQTRRQWNYLRSGRICLMDLHFRNDRSKFKSDWNGLLRWGGKKDGALLDCASSWKHWTSNALYTLVQFREKCGHFIL